MSQETKIKTTDPPGAVKNLPTGAAALLMTYSRPVQSIPHFVFLNWRYVTPDYDPPIQNVQGARDPGDDGG